MRCSKARPVEQTNMTLNSTLATVQYCTHNTKSTFTSGGSSHSHAMYCSLCPREGNPVICGLNTRRYETRRDFFLLLLVDQLLLADGWWAASACAAEISHRTIRKCPTTQLPAAQLLASTHRTGRVTLFRITVSTVRDTVRRCSGPKLPLMLHNRQTGHILHSA